MDLELQVYHRAQRRIEELRGELSRLQAFVATYDELAGEVGVERNGKTTLQTGDPNIADHASVCDGNIDVQDAEPQVKATPQAELERIVGQVISTHGAPLHRMELFERVKALGVVIGGKKELLNFGSKLSRAESLVNLPKLGYWPKDRPFEPGRYSPLPIEPPSHSDGL